MQARYTVFCQRQIDCSARPISGRFKAMCFLLTAVLLVTPHLPTMKKTCVALTLALLAPWAAAQFTGPAVEGRQVTVQEVGLMLPGRYVTVVGHVVAHQREDYYLFRDGTGEMRVQIEDNVWRGRPVNPQTRVRLQGEIDVGVRGRYLWVNTLQIVE